MSIDWPGGSWEATVQMVLLIFGTFAVMLWLATLYWTYRDIRQRTRDFLLQTFSVALVLVLFPAGLLIYMILRPRYTLAELYERSLEEEALLQDLEDQKACPTCRRRVKDDFLVCPSCRTQLKELCRSCQRPLSYAWNACPYCGLEKAPRVQSPPPRARVASAPPPPVGVPAQAAASQPPPPPAEARMPRPAPSRVVANDTFARSQPHAGDDAVIDLVD